MLQTSYLVDFVISELCASVKGFSLSTFSVQPHNFSTGSEMQTRYSPDFVISELCASINQMLKFYNFVGFQHTSAANQLNDFVISQSSMQAKDQTTGSGQLNKNHWLY